MTDQRIRKAVEAAFVEIYDHFNITARHDYTGGRTRPEMNAFIHKIILKHLPDWLKVDLTCNVCHRTYIAGFCSACASQIETAVPQEIREIIQQPWEFWGDDDTQVVADYVRAQIAREKEGE